jgi:hypothetical protein
MGYEEEGDDFIGVGPVRAVNSDFTEYAFKNMLRLRRRRYDKDFSSLLF